MQCLHLNEGDKQISPGRQSISSFKIKTYYFNFNLTNISQDFTTYSVLPVKKSNSIIIPYLKKKHLHFLTTPLNSNIIRKVKQSWVNIKSLQTADVQGSKMNKVAH